MDRKRVSHNQEDNSGEQEIERFSLYILKLNQARMMVEVRHDNLMSTNVEDNLFWRSQIFRRAILATEPRPNKLHVAAKGIGKATFLKWQRKDLPSKAQISPLWMRSILAAQCRGVICQKKGGWRDSATQWTK
jgi:hypothetical protein